MKQYADFEFYQKTYCGQDIDEEQFNRLAIGASYFIDSMTLGRIKEPSDEVKLAMCAIAEIGLKECKQENEDQIASESVGPHSVSYVKKTKTTEEYRKMKLSILRTYLANTGLLYRGIPS